MNNYEPKEKLRPKNCEMSRLFTVRITEVLTLES